MRIKPFWIQNVTERVLMLRESQRGDWAHLAAGPLLTWPVQGFPATQRETRGRAAPSRTGRAPYPARRKSHSDEKRGSTDDGPIHQLHSSSGA